MNRNGIDNKISSSTESSNEPGLSELSESYSHTNGHLQGHDSRQLTSVTSWMRVKCRDNKYFNCSNSAEYHMVNQRETRGNTATGRHATESNP